MGERLLFYENKYLFGRKRNCYDIIGMQVKNYYD